MKLSVKEIRARKSVTPIPMLTAYTAPIAQALEKAGVPVLLVGDTVGMVEMGMKSTREVTIEHMEYHVAAVRRGAPNTHIIGDMPFNSDKDPVTALKNAERLLSAGADSIKLEGPKKTVIRHLLRNSVDVVGHTGLTPQTSKNFKQVGARPEEAERITNEAREIEEAGAFMIVLEHIPDSLAEAITRSLSIPTIGIGAGSNCDGQVLVINDVLGLGDKWPPFSKQYTSMGEAIVEAGRAFIREVEENRF